nr:MAG TPA: hypothetical protein [Caudoviricetes sp.]
MLQYFLDMRHVEAFDTSKLIKTPQKIEVDIFRRPLISLAILNHLQCLVIPFPQKVAIPLHKLFALIQIIGAVIGGADFVVFNVSKLPLYRIRVEALFIQNAAGKGTETMRGYSAFIAHALNDTTDGCVADKTVRLGTARKQKRGITRDFFQLCQKFKRPISQRHSMGRFRRGLLVLHTLGGNCPHCRVKVYFIPLPAP